MAPVADSWVPRGGLIEPLVVGSKMPVKAAACDFERRLAAQQILELLLKLLLVEKLAAGGAIDPGAQFGDAVLVGVLLVGLTRHQAPEEIVAEGEIGRGRHRPPRHDDDAADGDPERDRPKPDLPSGMGDRIARAGSCPAPISRSRLDMRIEMRIKARRLPLLSRLPTRH